MIHSSLLCSVFPESTWWARLFAWRLLTYLYRCPLWGTWGLLPLSKYARAVQAGTTRARSMMLAPLLRNSSSGLLVVGPLRLFAWRLLRPPPSPPVPAVGHLGAAAAVQVRARRASGYHAGM